MLVTQRVYLIISQIVKAYSFFERSIPSFSYSAAVTFAPCAKLPTSNPFASAK